MLPSHFLSLCVAKLQTWGGGHGRGSPENAAVRSQPPAWVLLGELAVAAVARSAEPLRAMGRRQGRLACAFAAALCRAAARACALDEASLKPVPADALSATVKPWDAPGFLEAERPRF